MHYALHYALRYALHYPLHYALHHALHPALHHAMLHALHHVLHHALLDHLVTIGGAYICPVSSMTIFHLFFISGSRCQGMLLRVMFYFCPILISCAKTK